MANPLHMASMSRKTNKYISNIIQDEKVIMFKILGFHFINLAQLKFMYVVHTTA